MNPIVWSETAVGDLESIRDYVGHDSSEYARLIVSRLYQSVDQLRHFPESGRIVPERGDPTLRELIRVPYRIVYRLGRSSVEILTVFHSKRAFPSETAVGFTEPAAGNDA